MNTPYADRAPDTGWYHIRVRGHLAPRWATRFDAMTLTLQDDGTTLIQGPVVDQAALHGLLRHVRDAGLQLVSVVQRDSDLPDASPASPAHRARAPLDPPLDQGEPA